ncbi:MAG: Uma2 family endonuclease [Planctomycetota bacterium]|nr:Uma2 family endonuclease [Planctomycetota bacterium]
MSIAEIPAIPQLGPGSAGVSMTPEEYDAVHSFDDDDCYESIHGVLVVAPFASEAQRSPNELLGHWLWEYGRQNPQGGAFVETLFEHNLKSSTNRRRADRVIWTAVGDHRPDPRVAPPTIVVEFVSAGKRAWRRDFVEKRDEYLAAGNLEYWVIDRFSRQFWAYSRTGGNAVEQVVHEGDAYRSKLLPGFELRLGELLAAADRWSGPE